MFSPGAQALGAGSALAETSPLKPRVQRAVLNDGTAGPGATPAQAAILAAVAGIAGMTLGAGGVPPTGVAGAPHNEANGRALGSTTRYDRNDDIGGDMSVRKLASTMKEGDFFGAKIPGDEVVSRRTSRHLADWFGVILASIRGSLPVKYYGGNFMDYMMDHSFDPVMVVGEAYFPSPGEDWSAFVAVGETVIRFEERKKIMRQHCADICNKFSEKSYWRPLCDYSPDGQSIVAKWQNQFLEDESVNINDRAEALRGEKFEIHGTEDPSPKLQKLLRDWQAISVTAQGAQFGVGWFAATVLGAIKANDNYSIFRQSGGKEKILQEKSPAQMTLSIINCWSGNHQEWKDDKKKLQAFQSKGGGKGTASGSGLVTCWNCGKLGHIAANCWSKITKGQKGGKGKGKGGGKKGSKGAGKGTFQGKTHVSNWTKAPCKYESCSGDRSTHAAPDCPDKIDNDKKSRHSLGREDKHTAHVSKKQRVNKFSRNTTEHRHHRSSDEQAVSSSSE